MTANTRLRSLLPVAVGGAATLAGVLAGCSTSPQEKPERIDTAKSASTAPGLGAAAGVIWTVDFTALPAGNAHQLTSLVPQLALSRASAATVQTSPSEIDTTPGVDEARIGDTGTARGLVIEEARTNFFTSSRNPGVTGKTSSGFTQVQPGSTVTAGYVSGPDGTPNGSRIQIPTLSTGTSAVAQWFYDTPGVLAAGDTLTFSEWLRPTSNATGPGAPIVQWGACDNAYHSSWALDLPGYNGTYLPTAGTQWTRSLLQPLRTASNGALLALAPAFQAWGWCGDLSAGVNSNVYSIDQVVDLIQAEKGYFATEPIVTGASTATRAGDHLRITNGAAAVDQGQLSLYLEMYPKGDALACPSTVTGDGSRITTCAPGYSAPAYLFYVDGGNYAVFNAQDQSVTLAVAGVTASSAINPILAGAGSPGGAANAGPAGGGAPISIFKAGQSVEWFIRAGGGAGLVQCRVNGGPIATLLDSPLSGLVAPAGAIDLLSAGTANQFSAWLAQATVYRSGQGGLLSQSTCSPALSGDGSIWFTTTGGGLSLIARSGPGAAAGSITTAWTISRGLTTVLSGSKSWAQGVTTTKTNYGAGFTGLTQSIMTFDGKTLTGSLNGRALVPETLGTSKGSVPAFADGAPGPAVTVDPVVQGKVSALVSHIRADANSLCPPSASPEVLNLLSVFGQGGLGTPGAH